MRHGMGYNCTTSQLAGCAVESMQLSPPNSDPTVNVTFHRVRSQEDVQRHIGTAIQASASVFGIGAKAAYDQAQSIQFSDTAMTAILECHIRQAPAFYRVQPTLTHAAKQLLRSNARAFTTTYGHYFIAGQICQSSLSAIMTFKAQSKEQLDDIIASAGASKGFVAVDLAASYLEKASKAKIATECTWHSVGIPTSDLSTHPTAEDIKVIFASNKKSKPKPQVALLEHYSMIDPHILLIGPGPQNTALLDGAIKEALNLGTMYGSLRSVEAQALLRSVKSTAEEITCIKPTADSWRGCVDHKLVCLGEQKQKLEKCVAREDLLDRLKELQHNNQAP
jgi:hypothetical protein